MTDCFPKTCHCERNPQHERRVSHDGAAKIECQRRTGEDGGCGTAKLLVAFAATQRKRDPTNAYKNQKCWQSRGEGVDTEDRE